MNPHQPFPFIHCGHAETPQGHSGVTVLYFDHPLVAGVFQGGFSGASRGLDTLRLPKSPRPIDGICLTGGSAYGLDASGGAMRALAEKGIGFKIHQHRIPLIPTAAIYDLYGEFPLNPPGIVEGRKAVENASELGEQLGSFGAAKGARIGKFGQPEYSASGYFSAKFSAFGEVVFWIAVVNNAFGNLIDPYSGKILRGNRIDSPTGGDESSTVLSVIVTNLKLDSVQCSLLAQLANHSVIRCHWPAQGQADGDITFVVSAGEIPYELKRDDQAIQLALEEALLAVN